MSSSSFLLNFPGATLIPSQGVPRRLIHFVMRRPNVVAFDYRPSPEKGDRRVSAQVTDKWVQRSLVDLNLWFANVRCLLALYHLFSGIYC